MCVYIYVCEARERTQKRGRERLKKEKTENQEIMEHLQRSSTKKLHACLVSNNNFVWSQQFLCQIWDYCFDCLQHLFVHVKSLVCEPQITKTTMLWFSDPCPANIKPGESWIPSGMYCAKCLCASTGTMTGYECQT